MIAWVRFCNARRLVMISREMFMINSKLLCFMFVGYVKREWNASNPMHTNHILNFLFQFLSQRAHIMLTFMLTTLCTGKKRRWSTHFFETLQRLQWHFMASVAPFMCYIIGPVNCNYNRKFNRSISRNEGHIAVNRLERFMTSRWTLTLNGFACVQRTIL